VNHDDKPKDPRPALETKWKSRFRIEKLEERIAPKKGGKGTNNCATLACTDTCYCGSY
jgi:hypothetical protein